MSKKTSKPAKMVNWYDPFQLKDTAKRTLISTIIGENADPRLVASLASKGSFFDYSKELVKTKDNFEIDNKKPREEIWIDYVSDVADGWNPTYSVAYTMAKEKLKLKELDEELKRGNILLFGGDEVYPTPTPEAYEQRLVMPYRMAFKAHSKNKKDNSKESDLSKNPHVFALPGNHDWYDSLVSFKKIFCTHIFNNRRFADAWQTRQEVSYFALKLPQRWWLFGVDLQLSHQIDIRQYEYFEKIAKEEMKAGDKVIVCVPEPYWVRAIKYPDVKLFENKEKSVEKFESMLQKRKIDVKLYLAGDLHHYRRFESNDGKRINKITAGGGGAFLHPTHDFDFEKNKVKNVENDTTTTYSLKKDYPTYNESRKLDWKNLYQFIPNNKTFGLLTAIVYIIIAGLIKGYNPIDSGWGLTFWKAAIFETFNNLLQNPLAFITVLALLLGLVFFTDSNNKKYRTIAGTIHGLSHLGAIFILGWLGFRLSRWIEIAYFAEHQQYSIFIWFLSVVFVCGIGGYFIGSFIMGLYLFVSIHFFGRHDNEAFSALKIEDYKHFVRLHIDKKGKLSIYPLKIEKVPQNWDPVKTDNQTVSYEPKEKLEPELIEKIKPLG